MYAAHVRLVTVLDLVSNEDPDYHDPLDRILKQQHDASGADEKSTLDQHQKSASTALIDHHDSRTWKIHKQEDLYQVNEFLKFTGTSLLAYAWLLFQIGASIVCVLMALFVRISPWAFQKEPARGGAEATIRQIDDDDDAAQHEDDNDSKAGGKSVSGTSGGEDSHSTNGNRRGSANSKASPSTQKKSWKNGGKKNGR